MENTEEAPMEYKKDPKITKTKLNEEYDKYDVYGSIFTLPVRYEIIKALGSGAYGGVALALDSK